MSPSPASVEPAIAVPLRTRLLSAFSLRKNLHALLVPKPDGLHAVDGLRALSILWVILFHSLKNLGWLFQDRNTELPFRLLNRGFMGVDVFFVLSGFLIARLLLRERAHDGTIDLRRFYLRRALRILPAYYVALAVYCALAGENCENGVWANLLYVNNFLPYADQCMPWSWSLAIEEQFYLVFPLFVIGLYRIKKFRLSILCLLMIIAVSIRWAVTAYYGLHLPGSAHAVHLEALHAALYIKPYTRYGDLLAGVIVAYLLNDTDAGARIARHRGLATVAAIAALAYVAYLSCRLQPVFVYHWSASANLVYYAASGYLFSIAIAYLLLLSILRAGIGRWTGWILSLRIWYPIGQVSYSAYLIHIIVIQQAVRFGLLGTPENDLTLARSIALVVVLSLSAATVLHLAIERPLMNLRRG